MEKKKILLIEDDKAISELYSERLGVDGFDITVATDGSIALDMALKGGFDLIILDIMMPNLGGIDVLDVLKNSQSPNNIPVLILTSIINEETQKICMAKGADDYIIKTKITPGELAEKIKRLL